MVLPVRAIVVEGGSSLIALTVYTASFSGRGQCSKKKGSRINTSRYVLQHHAPLAKVRKSPNNVKQVNPYHKPESLMKLNPRGLVPTLQYDNKPLYESTVIGEFLEDAYPDHGSRLLPSDPYRRATSRIWTDFVSTRVIPSFQRFLQFQSNESNGSFEQVRDEFLNTLKDFTKAMDKDGPYFEGENPALVDFNMAPFALRLWVFDHFKGGAGVPAEGQGGDSEEIWSRWRKWLSAMANRRSIKETTSEREHYVPIYQR
ncbi:hypothetical protein MMC26_007407 [Xylographa opegraphella]|nr:hypothetical protein [Xylographa opegraphella]